MKSLLRNIFSFLIITQFALGNFANVFIALVNCIDWVKGKKISCADRILTALAISRIGLLWVTLLNWYATVFNPAFYSSEVGIIIHITWAVSNHFSLWFAVCLSTLYLLQIANFSSLYFLHLKWKAKRVVVVMLLGTLVFLVCHLAAVTVAEKVLMNTYEGNVTHVMDVRDIVALSNITVIMIIVFIPFTTSLTALLLLLFSLWKHLKKMQLSSKGLQDVSTKVHIRAMQTVVSFLMLFAVYFLTVIVSAWNFNTHAVVMFCQALGLQYPSSHSFILIWGNKKLRQAILSFLWQPRCCLKERK